MKFIFVLFAVFLTTQVTASAVPNLTSAIDDVIEIAKQILLFINEVIDEDVNDVTELINYALDNLDNLRNNAVNQTEELIQRELELINQLIDAFKTQVNESGIDILNCVEGVEAELTLVSIQSLNMSLICMNSAVETTSKVLLEILGDVKDINADFKVYEDQLEDCKTKLVPIACVKEVIDKLGEIAATVPAKAKEDGRKAEQSINDLVRALDTCGKDAARNAQENNIVVFNDFAQCVWDKEHNPTR